MKIDERALRYCKSQPQVDAVRAVIKHGTQRAAAEALGKNVSNIGEVISRVRRNAREDQDFLLDIKSQSLMLFNDDGKFIGWNKTRHNEVEWTFDQLRQGVDCKTAKPKTPPKYIDSSVCSVLPIADVHLGMMAYTPETGKPSWGTDTARDLLMTAIDILLPRSHKVDHGIVLNVGDLTHYSGMDAKTAQSGNILESDARPGYMLRTAIALMIYAIDRMLKSCNTVEVLTIQGNHDELVEVLICLHLQAYYRNEPRVTIPDNDCKVLTTVWEKNFIYAHHGDGITNQKMYNAMTRDFPREFGNANHRWGVCGHLHSSRKEPIGGAEIETFSTLATPDAWHASKLYGSQRKMHRIDLHAQGGEIGRMTFNPVLHTAIEEAA